MKLITFYGERLCEKCQLVTVDGKDIGYVCRKRNKTGKCKLMDEPCNYTDFSKCRLLKDNTVDV